MKRKIKNILIRDLNDDDREAIQVVMQDTGCFQASKAVMRAVHSFVRSFERTKRMSKRIQDLECQNQILRQNAALILKATSKLESVLELSKEENKKMDVDN